MDIALAHCLNGVWIAPLTTDFLCGSCRHRIAHWRGGATCATDPIRLTVTRACRGYEPWASKLDERLHGAFRASCDDVLAGLEPVHR